MPEDSTDAYADGFAVRAGPYGISVVFYRSDIRAEARATPDAPGEVVAVIRMAHGLAGALGQALNKGAEQTGNSPLLGEGQ